jgi:hypothetical protein
VFPEPKSGLTNKIRFMKKFSCLKPIILVLAVIVVSLTVMQCTKVGVTAKQLNRGLPGIADSTVFAPFYDTTKIAVADAVPSFNDVIFTKGVQTTIKEYCGVSTCHGGPVSPKLSTFEEIRSLVVPGQPESSKLWHLITTNDLNKAMPPVNAQHELSLTDKTLIYNWIKNGAKEFPALEDYRPAAISLIVNGCSSGNCHNVATATGAWARAGHLPGITPSDTATFVHVRAGGTTNYTQLVNAVLREQVWNAYKDSVRKFYADTVTNASFRPFKTFSTPRVISGVRGPLGSYDDILLDIWYPKGQRSQTTVQFSSGGINYYVRGNHLNSGDCFIRRIDSTLIYHNVFTGAATSISGNMSYDDGGLNRSEIALIKAWYFADPNIPDIWKYGNNNTGIFKFNKPPYNFIRK